jgi:phosphoribosylaminoimidazole-succinocarboxamide synthase
MNAAQLRSHLPSQALRTLPELPFEHLGSGKVRELYAVDADTLLIIATDRLSAFDVILPDGIPGKGIILTQISLYWFAETQGIVRNHLVADHAARVAALLKDHPDLMHRSMLVRRLQPLPLEAVVRGYLSGSGWKHYLEHGTLFGQIVPEGLGESAKLPVPLFTPTTKAAAGNHDLPVSVEKGESLVGAERFSQLKDISLQLFALGRAAAKQAGLILADTKFEFGLDADGALYLIDEVLTPDSSRYWPSDVYTPGQPQPAFDKQFVRDYLETLDWNKTAPGPTLPTEVIDGTLQRYLAAFAKIVG